jgi:hypothetical protein
LRIVSDGDNNLFWVILHDHKGRFFIEGNPHTHPGRFGVTSENGEVHLAVSKKGVKIASLHAWAWISGFLAGNEPGLEKSFGPDPDERQIERWNAERLRFKNVGDWTFEPWFELTNFPSSARLPAFVWALRADEVWSFVNGEWRATPGVISNGGFIVNSSCFKKREHELEVVLFLSGSEERVDPGHLVCVKCGRSYEVHDEDPSARL